VTVGEREEKRGRAGYAPWITGGFDESSTRNRRWREPERGRAPERACGRFGKLRPGPLAAAQRLDPELDELLAPVVVALLDP